MKDFNYLRHRRVAKWKFEIILAFLKINSVRRMTVQDRNEINQWNKMRYNPILQLKTFMPKTSIYNDSVTSTLIACCLATCEVLSLLDAFYIQINILIRKKIFMLTFLYAKKKLFYCTLLYSYTLSADMNHSLSLYMYGPAFFKYSLIITTYLKIVFIISTCRRLFNFRL